MYMTDKETYRQDEDNQNIINESSGSEINLDDMDKEITNNKSSQIYNILDIETNNLTSPINNDGWNDFDM